MKKKVRHPVTNVTNFSTPATNTPNNAQQPSSSNPTTNQTTERKNEARVFSFKLTQAQEDILIGQEQTFEIFQDASINEEFFEFAKNFHNDVTHSKVQTAMLTMMKKFYRQRNKPIQLLTKIQDNKLREQLNLKPDFQIIVFVYDTTANPVSKQ